MEIVCKLCGAVLMNQTILEEGIGGLVQNLEEEEEESLRRLVQDLKSLKNLMKNKTQERHILLGMFGGVVLGHYADDHKDKFKEIISNLKFRK